MIKYLFILFLTLNSYANESDPTNGSFSDFGGRATVFKKLKYKNKYTFKLKFLHESSSIYEENSYSNNLIGLYYMMPLNQKIGFFVSSESGIRHNDDWTVKDAIWSWQDTSSRVETVFHLIHSIKFRPTTRPLLYELQTRFLSYSFNGNQAIEFGPVIHYFITEKGIPKYSFRAKIPLYFALNFGDEFLYKKGLYTAGMIHFNKIYTLGLSYQYLIETWSTSTDTQRVRPNQTYTSQDTTQRLLMELIANF